MYDTVPIGMLQPGQSGEIDRLHGHPSEVHRLEEMGLKAGKQVQMVRSGETCIVRLDGTRLCFRSCDSLGVLVSLGEVS